VQLLPDMTSFGRLESVERRLPNRQDVSTSQTSASMVCRCIFPRCKGRQKTGSMFREYDVGEEEKAEVKMLTRCFGITKLVLMIHILPFQMEFSNKAEEAAYFKRRADEWQAAAEASAREERVATILLESQKKRREEDDKGLESSLVRVQTKLEATEEALTDERRALQAARQKLESLMAAGAKDEERIRALERDRDALAFALGHFCRRQAPRQQASWTDRLQLPTPKIYFALGVVTLLFSPPVIALGKAAAGFIFMLC